MRSTCGLGQKSARSYSNTNGSPIGMGAEKLNVDELVKAYGPEEVEGAILIAPKVEEFAETFEGPVSLRWFTSREHGPANFAQASGAWRKTL